MHNISKEYVVLFQAISHATQMLSELQQQLQLAQQQAEELYIAQEEAVLPIAM